MKRHRLVIDILQGTAEHRDCDAIEIAAGELGYRAYDRTLRPFSSEPCHVGSRYISTAWHVTEADARAEAVAALERRIAELRHLITRCHADAGQAGGEA